MKRASDEKKQENSKQENKTEPSGSDKFNKKPFQKKWKGKSGPLSSKSNKDRNEKRNVQNNPRTQKTSICYKCGRNNHYAKDYFAKTKLDGSPIESKPNQAGSRKVNLILQDAENKTEVLTVKHFCNRVEGTFKGNKNKQVKTTTNLVVGGGRLLEKDVKCNETIIKAVVDTGACVSVLDETAARKNNFTIKKSGINLIGADGNNLFTVGSTEIEISIKIGNC